ncbi:hypothetical protein [Corallococcus sp. CA053C]|uniref:hypothetical protein n=1 Tax=Corallococcus sp. CA053C TaxID=2316732 RepID=UPI0011C41DD5|nr:hypothetical protein [Corallococcus sp. CA053C]
MADYMADSRISVFPFTRREEGGEVIIGRPDTAVFLALPAEAVALLDDLAGGSTVGEARARYQERCGDDPDLQDLLGRLEHEGFVWPEGGKGPSRGNQTPLRFHFENIPESLARRVFSWPMLAVYCVIIAAGAALLLTQPELMPGWRALFFTQHITLSYLLLTVLGYLSVFLHEMAHLLAARSLGVPCRLGVGNRLWLLVAETDMTGIWRVAPRQRYLPFLAGPMLDAVSASLLLFVAYAAQHGVLTLSPLGAALVQAMLLRYLMGIAWQCYFFVRTDFYYVICNVLGCKNLLGDTVTFLKNLASRALPWFRYEDQSHIPAHERRAIRLYSVVWLGGRVLALTVGLSISLPLLWHYGQLLFGGASSTTGAPGLPTSVDVLGMTLVALGPQLLGMWLWFRSFRKPQEV